jgi:hypothetical protein
MYKAVLILFVCALAVPLIGGTLKVNSFDTDYITSNASTMPDSIPPFDDPNDLNAEILFNGQPLYPSVHTPYIFGGDNEGKQPNHPFLIGTYQLSMIRSYSYWNPSYYVATDTNGDYRVAFKSYCTEGPERPTQLTATTIRSSVISLAWVDNSFNELGFEIYRRTDDITGSYTLVATVDFDIESYQDQIPADGTDYLYFVRAYNTLAYSDSEEVSATASNGTTPVELSSFTAAMTAQNDVRISWISQTETNLLGYRLYRSETNAQQGSVLITPSLVPATNTSEQQTYGVTDNEVNIGTTYYYWLESVDPASSEYHGPVSVSVQGNTPPVIPEFSSLQSAYPNPFKATGTSIGVSLKAGETGTLSIYNVSGQVVRSYSVTEGYHNIVWNGRDNTGAVCGSGIYYYNLSTPSVNQTKKLIFIK